MRTVSKGLFMFAGLLATPIVPLAQMSTPTNQTEEDPRLVRLKEFLHENDCPIKRLASDFIEAADKQDLDWRLLPSIAVVESGGGKRYKNNNVFGWGNCERRFPSVRAGIHIVAERLANSRLYRDKNIDQLLRTYNPEQPNYAQKVKAVMSLIGSFDPAASTVN